MFFSWIVPAIQHDPAIPLDLRRSGADLIRFKTEMPCNRHIFLRLRRRRPRAFALDTHGDGSASHSNESGKTNVESKVITHQLPPRMGNPLTKEANFQESSTRSYGNILCDPAIQCDLMRSRAVPRKICVRLGLVRAVRKNCEKENMTRTSNQLNSRTKHTRNPAHARTHRVSQSSEMSL